VFISLPVKLLKSIILLLMPHLSPKKMDSSYILSETGEDGNGSDKESNGPDEEQQVPDEETEPKPEEN
jgi:hypothetical protein